MPKRPTVVPIGQNPYSMLSTLCTELGLKQEPGAKVGLLRNVCSARTDFYVTRVRLRGIECLAVYRYWRWTAPDFYVVPVMGSIDSSIECIIYPQSCISLHTYMTTEVVRTHKPYRIANPKTLQDIIDQYDEEEAFRLSFLKLMSGEV